MINELIEQIGGRERLEEMFDFFGLPATHGENRLMARALLEVLDAQDKPGLVLRPFGYDGETFIKADIDHHAAVAYYTTPPAASVPEGWRLVPVEPTIEMREAYHQAEEDFQECCGTSPDSHWAAMLAAAPAPGDKK